MRTRHGWIKSVRTSKAIKFFLAVTDGTEDFQMTIKDIDGEFKVGQSVTAKGEDSTTPRGLYEFLVSEIEIIGTADETFPIQPKEHTSDFLRTIPELRGRAAMFQAVWRIRHRLTQEIHRFFDAEGFFQYYTPIITHADCEGAGETFSVKSDWMDEKLTVSGQLHGEVGMMSLGKIYTFSPCFRAEKSATKKHLSEFWMIEPEMAHYDIKDTVHLAQILLKTVIRDTILKNKKDFEILKVDTDKIFEMCNKTWFVLPYETVASNLKLKNGEDISSESEKQIVDKIGGVPIFITHYPKELKPFYMRKDGNVANCFDLIFPEVGELIGGSERESDYNKLKASIKEAGLDEEKMQWYLSTRKYGSVPHSGFGMGFERLLLFLTKMDKIHDVIPFSVHFK